MPFDARLPKKEGDYIFPHMTRVATPTGHFLKKIPVTTSWAEVVLIPRLHGSIATIRITSVTSGVTFAYCFQNGEQSEADAREDTDIAMDVDPPQLFIQGSAAGFIVLECWFYEDTSDLRGDG